MLYFILGIVILVVIKFWNDKEKEVSKVNAQGGMMNKYRELISYFREISNSQILPKEDKIVWFDSYLYQV